jgi:hypothetical protein
MELILWIYNTSFLTSHLVSSIAVRQFLWPLWDACMLQIGAISSNSAGRWRYCPAFVPLTLGNWNRFIHVCVKNFMSVYILVSRNSFSKYYIKLWAMWTLERRGLNIIFLRKNLMNACVINRASLKCILWQGINNYITAVVYIWEYTLQISALDQYFNFTNFIIFIRMTVKFVKQF